MKVRYKWLGIALLIAGRGFGITDSSMASQAAKSESASSAIFEFHNGFWVNLHHFLYWEALASVSEQSSRPITLTEFDTAELTRLSPAEKTTWNSAVIYYRDHLIPRDLLFDRGMAAIKNALEDGEATPDLRGVEIPADVRTSLLKAAPIYRKDFWPNHSQLNQHWISALKPVIEAHGRSIRDSLVKIYDEPWPGEPVRVDAVVYANWAGAYTTSEPTRPTISTSDPANQGTAALEIVFHETSHGMVEAVINAINAAERAVNAQRTGKPIRFQRDLWHAVLFYTAGELVVQQIPGYVPYADKNGLWIRAWSGPDRGLIEADWKPHMTGSQPLTESLTKLVNDLASASDQNK